MIEATQRPWKRIETDMFGIYAIKGKRIAEVLPRPADKGFGFASEAIANADLIVRAVNAHDALVAAVEADGKILDQIYEILDGKEWDSDTTAAIAGTLATTGRIVRDPAPEPEPNKINGERLHQLSDGHGQGTHDSDPQMDCYDCWPWINGYGARVLEALKTIDHPKLDWEWWHSGGGLHGIAVQKGESFYFTGAADEPNVGMDISEGEGMVASADFGSLEDQTEEQMAERIWQAVWNGKGVVS